MATAGYKARVLIGDFSFSPKLSEISLPFTVDMHDATTFGDDGVKRFLPGTSGSSAAMTGFIDADTLTEAAAWTSTQALTYAPSGLARGSRVQFISALESSFEVGSSVAGLSSFDLGATTDGFTDFGVSLRDLAAATVDGNDTGHDFSAASSGGGAGCLHVTAFSGLTNAIIKVQHSTDNSVYTDLITFTTATGVTSQISAVAGTVNRYVRSSVDVTGTGSVTFQVSFSRR